VARNRENTEAVIERKMPGKAVAVTHRAALGNISNRTALTSNIDGVKVQQCNALFSFLFL